MGLQLREQSLVRNCPAVLDKVIPTDYGLAQQGSTRAMQYPREKRERGLSGRCCTPQTRLWKNASQKVPPEE